MTKVDECSQCYFFKRGYRENFTGLCYRHPTTIEKNIADFCGEFKPQKTLKSIEQDCFDRLEAIVQQSRTIPTFTASIYKPGWRSNIEHPIDEGLYVAQYLSTGEPEIMQWKNNRWHWRTPLRSVWHEIENEPITRWFNINFSR